MKKGTKTIYCSVMFYLINFNDFSKYMLIINLTAATLFKQKGWESCETL